VPLLLLLLLLLHMQQKMLLLTAHRKYKRLLQTLCSGDCHKISMLQQYAVTATALHSQKQASRSCQHVCRNSVNPKNS